MRGRIYNQRPFRSFFTFDGNELEPFYIETIMIVGKETSTTLSEELILSLDDHRKVFICSSLDFTFRCHMDLDDTLDTSDYHSIPLVLLVSSILNAF
jgi:hypothetical protein